MSNEYTKEMAEEQFRREQEEQFRKNYRRPNILVCGYTGSGKSSLVNAILGDDVVPPSAIGEGKPKTMGFEEYASDLVRVFDSKGMENGDTEEKFVRMTQEFIRQRQDNPNLDEHIHIVWYVIQGSGARVTDCDKRLITRIFNPRDVIVVLTKADITREKQREALKAELLASGVAEDRIVFTADKEGKCEGCAELMRMTHGMLDGAYRDAFMAQQEIDKEAKRQAVEGLDTKANVIIGTATAGAAGAAVSPIPFSDAALIVPAQVTMIASLAGLYGVSGDQIKAQALPFVAKLAGTFLAGNALKFIPFFGSIAGAVINGTVAAGITGGMGLYVKSLFKETALAKIDGRKPPEMVFDPAMFEKFRELYNQNRG